MINGRGDPVFDVLRDLTGTPAPTAEQTETARARLDVAIAAEPTRRRRRRLQITAVGATAVVLALAVVASMIVRAPQVNASLVELAEATRLIPATQVTADEYVYTAADRVDLSVEQIDDEDLIVLLLPRTIESWMAVDGTALITTTVGQPQFFNTAHEAAYFALRVDRSDRVGETFTETRDRVDDETAAIDWPTDPEALQDAMLDDIRLGESPLPEDAQLLELGARIIRAGNTTSALRAAVLEVIATLDTIEVDTSQPDQLTVSVTYLDRNTTVTATATFDQAGQLVAESMQLVTDDQELGIPAGTTISSASYTTPAIVDTSGQVP